MGCHYGFWGSYDDWLKSRTNVDNDARLFQICGNTVKWGGFRTPGVCPHGFPGLGHPRNPTSSHHLRDSFRRWISSCGSMSPPEQLLLCEDEFDMAQDSRLQVWVSTQWCCVCCTWVKRLCTHHIKHSTGENCQGLPKSYQLCKSLSVWSESTIDHKRNTLELNTQIQWG